MKRTAAALLLCVLLLATAACGSGTSGPSQPGTTSSSTPLTPAAYRTKVNALCVQAKQKLGGTTASSAAASQASATAALEKALGIFQPILTTMQTLKPPTALAAGHRTLVASLSTLVSGGQGLITKLKAGTPLLSALTSAQVQSFSKAFAGMKTGFATLGLTTCTRLIGG
ncbi:MAG TPA: hypothetical protein VKR79_07240 [Gaiellaceae bacterium]|nr:hypothetical protein [Gaiellaceae bacterium]